jgi:hypothetical protein
MLIGLHQSSSPALAPQHNVGLIFVTGQFDCAETIQFG